MPAVDTNVLARFLVRDDAAQGRAAEALIRSGIDAGEALFVPVTVALELEWVLRSAFGFDKAAVCTALSRLLASFEVDFESEASIEAALATYEQSTPDFADCLHVALARHAGRLPFWTFDRAAAKLTDARLPTAAR